MADKRGGEAKTPSFRRQAEEILKARAGKSSQHRGDIDEVIHELEVHQIELEMQNEQLSDTVAELELSREKYADLYDFAPVGSLTLDSEGTVREANLAAAALLGCARASIIGKRLSHYISLGDRRLIKSHILDVISSRGRGVCDLTVKRTDGTLLSLHLESIAFEDAKGETLCRSALTDETIRKKAEQEIRHLASFPQLNPNPVIETDSEGKVTFHNPVATTVLRELLGKEDLSAFFPADVSDILDMLRQIQSMRTLLREVKIGDRVFEENVYLSAELRVMRIYAVDITKRKQAEEASKANEERLEVLYSSMSEGLAIHEIVYDNEKAVDYVITDVNPAYEEITGLARSVAVGKKASELYGLGEAPYLDVYAKVASTGEPFSFEIYFPPMQRSFAISAFSPGRGQFGTVFQDITERKQAEEKLRTTLERVELLAANASRLIQARDPRALVHELCVPVMQALGCQAFFNFMVDPVAGRLRLNAYAGITPERAAQIEWLNFGEAVCGTVARDRHRIVAEHILTSTDPITDLSRTLGLRAYCAHPLLEDENRTLGTLSFGTRNRDTFRDDEVAFMKAVSDQVTIALVRAQDEQALRESQRQNEFLADVVRHAAQPFGQGFPDGRLGLVNKAFEELTGYSEDELRSMDWSRVLTPPEWREFEKQKLEELHRTGKPVRYEKEYIRKDGTRIPTELLVHLVADADGNPLYYYSFLTDITERKRAQEEIRRHVEDLERFNRAAVGRELRMIELKREVNELHVKAGESPRYPLDFDERQPNT